MDEIDKLEMLAEKGSCHIFGKVSIDQQKCLQQIDSCQTALTDDLARARQWTATHSPAAVELQNARTEAEHIIEEAKREAARIVEEAQRNRETPWSS
jgi:cell division septum initiation protein DivIVA